MEQILIPSKKARELEKTRKKVEEMLSCRIEVREDNEVIIQGDAYNEYNAKNVIQAFGRGFEIGHACRLLSDEYFFKFINLKDFFRNEEQIKRIKARVIGENGRAKLYIEAVSGAELSIYGNTIAMIGKIEEINLATVALQILIDGGTHKKAYRVMERLKRKLKEEAFW